MTVEESPISFNFTDVKSAKQAKIAFENGYDTQNTLQNFTMYSVDDYVVFVNNDKKKDFLTKNKTAKLYFGDVSIVDKVSTFGASSQPVLLNFKYNYDTNQQFNDKPARFQIRWFDRGDGGEMFQSEDSDDSDSALTDLIINNLNFSVPSNYQELVFPSVFAGYSYQDFNSNNFQVEGSTDIAGHAHLENIVWDDKFYETWDIAERKFKNPNKDLDWHLSSSFQSPDSIDEDDNEASDLGLVAKSGSACIYCPALRATISYSDQGAKIEDIQVTKNTENSVIGEDEQSFGRHGNIFSLTLVGIYDQDDESISEHSTKPIFWVRTTKEYAEKNPQQCKKKGVYWYCKDETHGWDNGNILQRLSYYNKFRYTIPLSDLYSFKNRIDYIANTEYGGYDETLSMPTFLEWFYDKKDTDDENKAINIYVRSKGVL